MQYTINKDGYTIRGTGSLPDRHIPGETRAFGSAAEMLRFCLKEGVFRQRYVNGRPYRFEHLHLGYEDHNKGYDYHLIDSFARWKITSDHLAAMRRAHRRYLEILNYLREVEPEWRPDVESTGNAEGIVHYADNSVERHEINKYGKRRHIMVTQPHGDVCF
jgi:hypothetical protein